MDYRADREISVSATWFTPQGRPARTFPCGRVCGEDGCGTALSIYNEGDYCSLHEPEKTVRVRGRKIA